MYKKSYGLHTIIINPQQTEKIRKGLSDLLNVTQLAHTGAGVWILL